MVLLLKRGAGNARFAGYLQYFEGLGTKRSGPAPAWIGHAGRE